MIIQISSTPKSPGRMNRQASLSLEVVTAARGGGHSIVKNTGGGLDSLESGILVGKRYFGVLQKY